MLPLLTGTALNSPADEFSPDAIRALYNQLTPEEKQRAIAMAKSTLARTSPQGAHT